MGERAVAPAAMLFVGKQVYKSPKPEANIPTGITWLTQKRNVSGLSTRNPQDTRVCCTDLILEFSDFQ